MHCTDCSVASRVVVMVQWLAIPTYGIKCFFHSKGFSSWFTLVIYSLFTIYIYIYIYNCRQYCFGLLGLISAVLIARMKVSL